MRRRSILTVFIVLIALMVTGCSGEQHTEELSTEEQHTEKQNTKEQNSGEDVGGLFDWLKSINNKDGVVDIQEQVPIEEGKTVVGFRFHQSGMAMGPYYCIMEKDDGFHVTIGSVHKAWEAMDGEYWELDNLEESGNFKYSEVVVDRTVMEDLTRKLSDANIMSMNGNNYYRKSLPGELDGGEAYKLEMLFSDGTKYNSEGSNTPSAFDAVYEVIEAFFNEHSDYSRYYPTEKPADTRPDVLYLQLGPENGDVKIAQLGLRFVTNEYTGENDLTIKVNDPQGEINPKGFFLSEYLTTQEPLPYDQYEDLFTRYDIWQYNSKSDMSGTGAEKIYIELCYEDGRELYYETNIPFENYTQFKKEAVGIALDYYYSLQAQ